MTLGGIRAYAKRSCAAAGDLEDEAVTNLSEEQAAIHALMARGRPFVIAFFRDADVTEDDLARVYYGFPITEEAVQRIKELLRERMPLE